MLNTFFPFFLFGHLTGGDGISNQSPPQTVPSVVLPSAFTDYIMPSQAQAELRHFSLVLDTAL